VNLRQATVFLLWCGHKTLDGEPLTEQELDKFRKAHAISVSSAGILLIKPEDHEYTPGEPFGF